MTKYITAIIATLLITSSFANADIAVATKALTAQGSLIAMTTNSFN